MIGRLDENGRERSDPQPRLFRQRFDYSCPLIRRIQEIYLLESHEEVGE